MNRIDIVVSNDRHHCEMAGPLARRMIEDGSYELRVLSLCEFRGIVTPERPLGDLDVPVIKLSRILRPPRVKERIRAAKPAGFASRFARELAWRTLLEGNLRQALESRPDLVILFNDAAYPYDRIVKLLKDKEIPFLLIQEGIRFEATEAGVDGALNQGRGGAAAIAVFGESSAEFFRKQGAPPNSIRLTGNPRFDRLSSLDLRVEVSKAREELNLGTRNLLFLSNPIEYHGYCTAESKLGLVRDFVSGIDPLFEDSGFRLVFKLHGNESLTDFVDVTRNSPHFSQIVFATNTGLYPLLRIVDAAVIFGTTAGLEALLFGVPLGVLELPGVGFLHDYVREEAAVPLKWGLPMSGQVSELMALKGRFPAAVDRYITRSLASRDDATTRVLTVVDSLLPLGVKEDRIDRCSVGS